MPSLPFPRDPSPAASVGASVPASAILRWLGPIALLALAVRVIYLFQIQDSPFFALPMGDSKSYDTWAQQIARGDWIGRDVFYQAPLYPYFLGALYTIFGRDLFIIRMVQSCLGAVSCALLAHAAWRLFSLRTGIVAGIVLALYAPAIFFDGLLQKTALDAFLTTVVLWLTSGLLTHGHRARTWLALGVAVAALSLTRENALLLAAAFGVWALTADRAALNARIVERALPFAAGLALLLLPVAVRNAYVGGGFYLTTSQFGPNLYLGNNPYTDGTAGSLISGRGSAEYERQDAVDLAERAEGRALTPAEVSSYWTTRTVAYIRSEPGAWLRLMLRKTALLWNDAEAFDTESQESYAQYSPVLAALSWVGRFGLLLPLAFIGVVIAWPDRHRLAIWYVLILSYAASVIVFFIYARYRYPLVPMLLPFAALTLSSGASLVRRLSRPQSAALAATTVALTAFTWWPLLDRRDMLAVTEHNLGAALQAEGQLDAAAAHYRAATSANPAYAPAYSNLGTALFARGQVEDAFAAYRRAIELSPDFADAHFNYGNALLARDNAPAAIEQFQLALKTTPNAPDVKTNLGIALLEAGRGDEGLTQITAAAALAPRSATIWRVLGEARAQLGQRDQALEALRRASELAPEDPQVQQALERLRDSTRTNP